MTVPVVRRRFLRRRRTTLVTRRVPEFALLTGLFLGGSLGGFALWATGDVHQSVLVAALSSYPFAGYAVRVDDDPTGVLVPRWIAAAAVLVGTLAGLDVLVQATDAVQVAATRGIFVGGLVAVPPVVYAVEYDESLGPPPGVTFAAAAVSAVALPLVGVLAPSWYGGAAAPLVALPAALYADRRGLSLSRRARGVTVLVGVVAATGLTVLGSGSGPLRLSVVVAAVALVVTPAVFFALTVRTSSF